MSCSESDSLFNGAALAVGCSVTFVVTLIVTAIVTYIVTYTRIKKKFFQDANASGKQKVATINALVYDEVDQPNLKSTEADFELQQNLAYGISHKESNPVYKSSILYVVSAIILYPFYVAVRNYIIELINRLHVLMITFCNTKFL